MQFDGANSKPSCDLSLTNLSITSLDTAIDSGIRAVSKSRQTRVRKSQFQNHHDCDQGRNILFTGLVPEGTGGQPGAAGHHLATMRMEPKRGQQS